MINTRHSRHYVTAAISATHDVSGHDDDDARTRLGTRRLTVVTLHRRYIFAIEKTAILKRCYVNITQVRKLPFF